MCCGIRVMCCGPSSKLSDKSELYAVHMPLCCPPCPPCYPPCALCAPCCPPCLPPQPLSHRGPVAPPPTGLGEDRPGGAWGGLGGRGMGGWGHMTPHRAPCLTAYPIWLHSCHVELQHACKAAAAYTSTGLACVCGSPMDSYTSTGLATALGTWGAFGGLQK